MERMTSRQNPLAQHIRKLQTSRSYRYRTRELDLRAGSAGEPLLAPETVLMEIKLPGVCPLWLSHLLSEVDRKSVV